MKNLFFIVFVLATTIAEAQQFRDRFNVDLGTSYLERASHGDGGSRFGGASWLPLFSDEQEVKAGLYAIYGDMSSKMDGYVYEAQEITIGTAWVWCPINYSYDKYLVGWFSPGYKFSKDNGIINLGSSQYKNRQNDGLLVINTGLIIRKDLDGFLYNNKFSGFYQNALSSEGESFINDQPYSAGIWNKDFLQLEWEGSLMSIRINPSGTLRLDPKIIFGYIDEVGSKTNFYAYGVGLNLCREEFRQPILSASLGFKTAPGIIPTFQAKLEFSLTNFIKHQKD